MANRQIGCAFATRRDSRRRKTMRLQFNRTERREARMALRLWRLDSERQEEEVLPVREDILGWRHSNTTDFSYSIPRRWLEKQVGRKWDAVYSDLCRMFHAESEPAREFMKRIKYLVAHFHAERYTILADFYVEESGVLCKKDCSYKWWRSQQRNGSSAIAPSPEDVERWLDDRAVGQIGTKLFWFVHTERMSVCYNRNCAAATKENVLEQAGAHKWEFKRITRGRHEHPAYRQDKPLSEQDIKFFRSVPEYRQAYMLRPIGMRMSKPE